MLTPSQFNALGMIGPGLVICLRVATHNYQESFDGRTVEQTRNIDIRTRQQIRAKAAPHVFRLPIVQKNLL
jgi:hypothetical protein